MRYVCAALAIALIWLQSYLWLSDSGYRETREIRAAAADVREQNRTLRRRNGALIAEVDNLKTSFEAAEERARTDLGMIGTTETFYQVVPRQAAVR